jgi:hypothetical protein
VNSWFKNRRSQRRYSGAEMMTATRDIQTFLKDQVVPAGHSRYGLVIGIDQYQNPQLNLRCARDDAQGIFDLMVDPECGVFPRENVHLLLHDNATSQNIRREVGQLRNTVGPDDTMWIYFAGHGIVQDKRLYWIAYDTDVDNVYGTGFCFSDFLQDIQSNRLLVLLDCCHAAAASLQKNRSRAVTPTMEDVFQSMHAEGRIILSSCKPSEQAVELDDVRHGAFTHYLIQGLRGEADHRQDGVVDVDELWDYLHGRVTDAARKVGKQQTPMRDGSSTPDFGLTLNAITTQHKRRMEETIRQHLGWDSQQELTTDEAEWCNRLVHNGPQTDDEWAVYQELERLVDGQARIGTIKRLVKIARDSATTNPAEAPTVAPADASVSRICASCGKYLKVQASVAGRIVPCPGCKALIHIAPDRHTLTIVQPAPNQSAKPKPVPLTPPPAAAPPTSTAKKSNAAATTAVPPIQRAPTLVSPAPPAPSSPKLSPERRRLLKWIAMAALITTAAIWGIFQLSPTSKPIQPTTPDLGGLFHWKKGNDWLNKQEFGKAIAEYDEAIRLDPNNADVQNVIAWLQATCENAEFRDGRQAIEHATAACELANWKKPLYFDTLAAAYAESGDFKQAVSWQQKAVDDPEYEKEIGQEGYLAAMRRLGMYKAGSPYSESR